jgi:hypothetical protein
MKFSSAFFVVLTSFVLAGSASTPAVVQGDVKTISEKVVALDKVISDLPVTGAVPSQFLVTMITASLYSIHDDDINIRQFKPMATIYQPLWRAVLLTLR